MSSWFDFLKQGLSRSVIDERIKTPGSKPRSWNDLKNLRPFFMRHKRKGIFGAILIVIATLLTFPQPLIIRFVTDDAITAKNYAPLIPAIILLVVVKFSEKIVNLFQDYFFSRFEQEIVIDIQEDLLDHVLRLPKSFFDDNAVGYIMTRLSTDVQRLRWFFSSTLVYILSETIRFIGGIVMLIILEWRITLIVLLPLPFVIWGMGYFAGKIRSLSQHEMEQEANTRSRLEESLTSSTLIKAFTTEKRTVDKVLSELKRGLQINIEQTTVRSFADLIVGLIPGFANALSLALGAILIIRDQWTLGSLLAYQGYLLFVYNPAQFVSSAIMQLNSAKAALDRVSAMYDTVPEVNGKGIKVQKLAGDLSFADVSFSYDQTENILEGVSFSIKSGEHIAIIGPSGVGKTTLISLILRFYQPASGGIFFDDTEAGEYEVQSLRQRIGYVSQTSQLMAGRISDNLIYGNPDATKEEIINACRKAEIHSFIQSLAEGYDTILEEGARNLSEGQRQRLCIARALIKDPDIFIMDEPTSSIDSVTENSILDQIPAGMLSKTIIIIAHRHNTYKRADKIFLLKDKQILASGSDTELRNNCREYLDFISMPGDSQNG